MNTLHRPAPPRSSVSARRGHTSLVAGIPGVSAQEQCIPAGGVMLRGEFLLPPAAKGLVIFVHGSGSSRHSPRNLFVARILQETGMATLLFDLLTAAEEIEDSCGGRWRFDIELLTRRLLDVTHWVHTSSNCPPLPIAFFGASTGAAAALKAAGELGIQIAAVVSRGGRPDLAGDSLESVLAPTLLIVGGEDDVVLRLNREALSRLHCEKNLHVVPGATHLFEEPGALEEAATAAAVWFQDHFTPNAHNH